MLLAGLGRKDELMNVLCALVVPKGRKREEKKLALKLAQSLCLGLAG